jgi:glycine cleavage system H protein
MNIPENLKYAATHEWARIEGDTATVGITDHAQHELTDIVFVELPAIGKKTVAGEPCAVVESVKAASDIYAPLSGEVIEVNSELESKPQLLNDDAFGRGWMFKIKLSNRSEIENLLTPSAYRAQIGG